MGTEDGAPPPSKNVGASKSATSSKSKKGKSKARDPDASNSKRRCISIACIACRKRKSKCDGNLPSCAACASVYGTECVYDPNSDHRRKGVYKEDSDSLKNPNTTFQTVIQWLVNAPEHEALELVKDIRSSENLDDIAEALLAREASGQTTLEEAGDDSRSESDDDALRFEKELSSQMGELRLETDATRFIGGTSNLIYDDSKLLVNPSAGAGDITTTQQYLSQEDAICSWTTVTADADLIIHLLNMYFTWHYSFFTILSKYMFFRDFFRGKTINSRRGNEHCTPLLVNSMLALGSHFTSWPAARSNKLDPTTSGDHFFREAKRLLLENDEYESPHLATIQALAIMSLREAGCARETKGWLYSGMSFRMACDMGLNVRSDTSNLDEYEVDARRITFWGCYLFDKCWSNYLGRPPQLLMSNITVPKFEVFPSEDADIWSPWTETGLGSSGAQPSRVRAVALLTSMLCEISSDILLAFYRPGNEEKKISRKAEIKRLSEFHTRLEAWRKLVPQEMEPRAGQLPHVLIMHMFFHLLFIHLFRPFLKYAHPNGPLPTGIQPRRICTRSAASISKLLRIYKRTHGLRQICNIVVYMVHSACTIHLLNLPDEEAQRDIVHNVRALEEFADSWLSARRTLLILSKQTQRWKIELPSDAAAVLGRADENYRNLFSPSPGLTSARSAQLPLTPSASIGTPILQRRTSAREQSYMANPTADFRGKMSKDTRKRSLHMSSTDVPEAVGVAGPSTRDQNLPSSASMPPTDTGQLGLGSILFDSYPNYYDSKDWWLKDQTAIFDQWASSSYGTSLGSDTADKGSQAQAKAQWNDTILGMADEGPEQDGQKGPATGNTELDEGKEFYDLEYLNFPSGSMSR